MLSTCSFKILKLSENFTFVCPNCKGKQSISDIFDLVEKVISKRIIYLSVFLPGKDTTMLEKDIILKKFILLQERDITKCT